MANRSVLVSLGFTIAIIIAALWIYHHTVLGR
jgi:hypothetical protein